MEYHVYTLTACVRFCSMYTAQNDVIDSVRAVPGEIESRHVQKATCHYV